MLRGRRMIVRAWRGLVRAADGDAYLAYVQQTGIADYAATPGFKGITVLRRTDGDVTEFLLLTRWESWDAIRAFTGPDPDKARYYPEDERFLLDLPDLVEHWEEKETGAG